MQHPSDAQLLRDYAARGSDPAFAGIVARHTDLVYSAALRQTGSPELARDLAQSVFTDLARKAGALARPLDEHASLAGWLYQATRFAVLTARREERRRLAREKMVMEQFDPAPAPDDTWAALAPVLDEAMAELGDADREAVVLRYFKNLDFSAVAVALGVSEAAAQKRVSRAVERLRDLIAKRGVTTGASGLVVLISAHAVLVAPAGLSATLATAALAGTTLITAATATVGKAIAMTTLQKTLITAALAAAVGIGIYEARRASDFRNQISTLEQRQAALTEQLTSDRDEATRQLATLRGENDRLNRNTPELLRLRGEVTTLRLENAGLSAARTNASAKSKTPETIYAAIGAATPEAGLRRLVTAAKMSDTSSASNFLGWRIGQDVPQETAEKIRGATARSITNTFANTASIRIVNQQMENDDLVRARVEAVEESGKVKYLELRFAREGAEWKPVVDIRRTRPSGTTFETTFGLPVTPELGPMDQMAELGPTNQIKSSKQFIPLRPKPQGGAQ